MSLILQEEYIDEPEAGNYVHIKEQRVTEWPVGFLSRPKRATNTIPDFFSPNAPDNRLQILRGLAAIRNSKLRQIILSTRRTMRITHKRVRVLYPKDHGANPLWNNIRRLFKSV